MNVKDGAVGNSKVHGLDKDNLMKKTEKTEEKKESQKETAK